MAESRMPATKAGKNLRTMVTNTRLLLSVRLSAKRYLPKRPTTADMVRITAVQQLPTIWDFFISFSDLMAMNLTMMWGMPK